MRITVKGNTANPELEWRGEEDAKYAVLNFNICENVTQKDGTTKPVWSKVTVWRKRAEGLYNDGITFLGKRERVEEGTPPWGATAEEVEEP